MSSLTKSQCFIDGQWVSASSGKTFEVKNPKNGEVIGSVPDMGREDTNKAIEAANKVTSMHTVQQTYMRILGRRSECYTSIAFLWDDDSSDNPCYSHKNIQKYA